MVVIGVFNKAEKSSINEIIVDKLINLGNNVIMEKDNTKVFIGDKSTNEKKYCIYTLSKELVDEVVLSGEKFDIIIYPFTDKRSLSKYNIEEILILIREEGYLIFNSELIINLNFKCYEIYPITFGLNMRNTITASSIDDVNGLKFSYCIQRALKTINNTVVEPCEIYISVTERDNTIEDYLAAYTTLILLGFLY